MSENLTMADAVALQTILEAVQGTKRVRWVGNQGAILEGVARAITREDGMFISADSDVRDGYVRISAMFEHFVPVREAMTKVRDGLFVIDQ